MQAQQTSSAVDYTVRNLNQCPLLKNPLTQPFCWNLFCLSFDTLFFFGYPMLFPECLSCDTNITTKNDNLFCIRIASVLLRIFVFSFVFIRWYSNIGIWIADYFALDSVNECAFFFQKQSKHSYSILRTFCWIFAVKDKVNFHSICITHTLIFSFHYTLLSDWWTFNGKPTKLFTIQLILKIPDVLCVHRTYCGG